MPQVSEMINGVNVPALKDVLGEFKSNPSLGTSHFRIHNEWKTCGQNRSRIDDFYTAGQEQHHNQSFQLECDEPELLLGEDAAPNPVEYLLHALAGCMTSSMVYHAAARGIAVESLRTEIEGDMNLLGFLGLDESVEKGYQHIRVKFTVTSDASPEKLKELASFSPVYKTLINPPDVTVVVEKG